MALFGNPFKITLAAVIGVELLSFAAHFYPLTGTIGLLAILAATLALTFSKLEYGLYIVLAELFVGSQGHLLDAIIGPISLSLRIGLFLVVLIAWLARRLLHRAVKPAGSVVWYYYGALFILVSLGLLQGFLSYTRSNVFFDGNAWLFFGLILIFFEGAIRAGWLQRVVQILLAASSWLALKTIIVLLLFSRGLVEIGGPLYRWIRDDRIGEITYVSGTIFRIFFQSQFYILIGFLLVVTLLFLGWNDWPTRQKGWLSLYLYISGLALIISQSRSFWIGGGVGLLALFTVVAWQRRIKFKIVAVGIIALGLLITSQLFSLQLITGNLGGDVVGSRFKDLTAEPAGLSRLNQLKPLLEAISARPLQGYGFGKTLTYQSSDPRVLETHPDGRYTTYAFEWGYLDIVLKIGSLGLLAYLALVSYILYQGLHNARFQILGSNEFKKPLIIGLLIGLIALLTTNIFSPYLNHPLGIGFVLLVSTLTLKNNGATA